MKKPNKKPFIGRVILTAIALLFLTIIFLGIRNTKRMNEMTKTGLEIIGSEYTLVEDTESKYQKINLYGIMNFDVNHYYAEGLGNVCLMKMNMGIMQMATLVITPYEKQMPAFTCDFFYSLNKEKAYIQFYDLVSDETTEEYQTILTKLQAVIDEYSDLSESGSNPVDHSYKLTVGAHKTGNFLQDDRLASFFEESVSTYTKISSGLPELNDTEKLIKRQITKEFCDYYIEKGGISTDTFIKALGKDNTRDFFYQVLYGPNY